MLSSESAEVSEQAPPAKLLDVVQNHYLELLYHYIHIYLLKETKFTH